MHFVSTFVSTVAVLASAVSAVQYTVNVGADNGLTYSPTSLSGVVAGDQISFKFLAKNHTITQSTFAAPCAFKAGGVDSGYVPVAANTTTFPEWTIQVDNVSAPLWFYCAQGAGAHCKAGMVFAINPTADKSFAAFLATAQGTTTNTTSSTTGTTTAAGSATSATSSTGTTVVNTTISGSGAAATTAAASSAFTVSARKGATLLAAVGVLASLTL